MNGAHSLLTTLVGAGVDVCFANPGTSEMHFVAALDTVGGMRGVLTLFEGVATGAADGYARIAGTPAAVLLHLGPGLGNGLANLHNARRAHTPMVVVVGDHATYHKKYDAPLESDIDAVAGSVSGWVHRTLRPADVAADTVAALEAARRGVVSTLILPADVSWSDGAGTAEREATGTVGGQRDDGCTLDGTLDDDAVRVAASALRSGERTVLLIGGDATHGPGLAAAVRIGEATGATVLCETFPARLERGAGVPAVERLAYFAEAAAEQLAGARHLVLAGAVSPVSFFAYPGKPSDLVPEGCTVHTLASHSGAAVALEHLADEVAPGSTATVAPAARPDLPTGELNAFAAATVIGALLPERAIVVDESNTAGVGVAAATAGAPAHDVLTLTGGAIGYGIPAAVGAAIAAPDRPVVSLQADGSALYTLSALWTQARENLDVTTVIFNNGAYDILRIELQRVGVGSGAQPGPKARELLDLGSPAIDFVRIAEGLGVPGRRVRTAEELTAALVDAFAEPGPHLIDAIVPSLLS
ncbi:acetolactate synthase large subunit [Mycolicibacterium chlorophenolicum]|uniref:acetolactate synthase n=1 Tax=Mycolicibacterium chlorophenolicum TaxID=37916 RepID=A0A0J6VE99_9MYCO|nr:acetolactate synthase large subunit [Mycolicibacterium chlorophenolicum]KMO67972.1 putative acetolactate synthase large subunit IlvX [Mycolicibacterium chlorophenolicum]